MGISIEASTPRANCDAELIETMRMYSNAYEMQHSQHDQQSNRIFFLDTVELVNSIMPWSWRSTIGTDFTIHKNLCLTYRCNLQDSLCRGKISTTRVAICMENYNICGWTCMETSFLRRENSTFQVVQVHGKFYCWRDLLCSDNWHVDISAFCFLHSFASIRIHFIISLRFELFRTTICS